MECMVCRRSGRLISGTSVVPPLDVISCCRGSVAPALPFMSLYPTWGDSSWTLSLRLHVVDTGSPIYIPPVLSLQATGKSLGLSQRAEWFWNFLLVNVSDSALACSSVCAWPHSSQLYSSEIQVPSSFATRGWLHSSLQRFLSLSSLHIPSNPPRHCTSGGQTQLPEELEFPCSHCALPTPPRNIRGGECRPPHVAKEETWLANSL